MIGRIYTGHDGQTHFEDLPLPAEESHNVALQAGANLVFRCFPADYWSDWHTAPRAAKASPRAPFRRSRAPRSREAARCYRIQPSRGRAKARREEQLAR